MKHSCICCLIILAFGCQGVEMPEPEVNGLSVCGIEQPMHLPWIADAIAYEGDYCTVYQITQGTYQGEDVFITHVSGALCCTCAGPAVYDCQGNVIFSCDFDKLEDVRNQHVIWERK